MWQIRAQAVLQVQVGRVTANLLAVQVEPDPAAFFVPVIQVIMTEVS